MPGATPTTPLPALPAAIVPATWVPCPLSSCVLPPGVMQFVPGTALRSGLARSTPESMTATAAVEVSCVVSAVAASMRLMPLGTVSPAASGAVSSAVIVRSALTETTCGSAFSALTWADERRAAKPLTACDQRRLLLKPPLRSRPFVSFVTLGTERL